MEIASLAAGDFDGLTSLKKLHLFRNDLTTLPAGIFEELSSLTHLDLNLCRLDTLPAGVFRGLTELGGFASRWQPAANAPRRDI